LDRENTGRLREPEQEREATCEGRKEGGKEKGCGQESRQKLWKKKKTKKMKL